MIFFGRRSLQRALKEFVHHYHEERNHQGLENRIIDPGVSVPNLSAYPNLARRDILAGCLRKNEASVEATSGASPTCDLLKLNSMPRLVRE